MFLSNKLFVAWDACEVHVHGPAIIYKYKKKDVQHIQVKTAIKISTSHKELGRIFTYNVCTFVRHC